MSRLDKIRNVFPDKVKVLEESGFTSDSDIRSLDRTDLRELFPGVQNRNMRRLVLFNIIQESAGATSRTRPGVLEKIQEEVSPEAARVLEKECYLDDLELLDRTDLLELFPGVEKLKWRKKIFAIIHPQMPVSTTDKMKKLFKVPNQKEVWYQKLDSGKSQNVSNQVIKKVTSKFMVQFIETTTEHKVSILFCPVTSRIGSDAEAAIASIKDDKPVILVFLIHSLKPQSISVLKPWDDSKTIVLYVHLFHHETKPGLLQCTENDRAISAIKNKLLEYSEESRQD